MCGIIGIHSIVKNEKLFNEIFEGLMCLQHRGQDSVGISNEFCIRKYNGLVKYAFQNENDESLLCQNYMGHVRYGTNGLTNNFQPFYTIFPRRISLCHNGNITNTQEVKDIIYNNYHILLDTQSDSEIILSLFSCKLYELLNTQGNEITEDKIFSVTNFLHNILKGSYCLIIIIKGYGMIAVRDKYGIRPLIFGKKEDNYIIASESVALNLLDYDIIRDMHAGETIIFKNNITTPYHNGYANAVLRPCLFEYIYFARPDSTIDKINVNEARIQIGRILGSKMKEVWDCNEIDYIIPVPDTSVTFANGIQEIIKRPLREGFIKNRYIDRTFIMKNKNIIQQNIRRKLSGIRNSFENKNVLIVDDSIVRGNTSKHLIKMIKKYGCKKVYFASCAPIITNTNNYGIYIPTKEELISFQRTQEEIRKELEVDYLIYNDLDKIIDNLKNVNKDIDHFEISMFL
tara:strand:+ start:477 stop:1850 length:1374 start_codon:yes stop_codon:yes gene_type:complete